MGDDGGVVAGGARQLPAVTRLLLQAAHDGALGHGAHGQDIPDVQLGCKEQESGHGFTGGPGWGYSSAEHGRAAAAGFCTPASRTPGAGIPCPAPAQPKLQLSPAPAPAQLKPQLSPAPSPAQPCPSPAVPTFLAAVDELAGVDALGGDEELRAFLEAVRVAEGDLGQRRAPPGVMDDVLWECRAALGQDTAPASL